MTHGDKSELKGTVPSSPYQVIFLPTLLAIVFHHPCTMVVQFTMVPPWYMDGGTHIVVVSLDKPYTNSIALS